MPDTSPLTSRSPVRDPVFLLLVNIACCDPLSPLLAYFRLIGVASARKATQQQEKVTLSIQFRGSNKKSKVIDQAWGGQSFLFACWSQNCNYAASRKNTKTPRVGPKTFASRTFPTLKVSPCILYIYLYNLVDKCVME